MSSAPIIEIGRGASAAPDSAAAGREAARVARSGLCGEPPSLVLVFASERHDLGAVVGAVRGELGPAPLAGATTAGEILDGWRSGSVCVVAIASRELEASVGAAGEVARDWRAALDRALAAPGLAPWFAGPERWREATRAGRSAFAILFTPGNTRHAASRSCEITDELVRRSGGRLAVFGGSAADDWAMERNHVLAGGAAIEDGIAVALVETSLQFGIAVAHGFHAGERRTVVTRAVGRDALELDGVPALRRYAELAGRAAGELGDRHLSLGTGLVLGAHDGFGEHLPLVASYATPAGGVQFTRAVPEGAVLRQLLPSPELSPRAAVQAFAKARLRGGIAEPALALVSWCALRPRLFGPRAEEEIPELARALGGTPLAGFRSFGEQGVSDVGATLHGNGLVSALVLGRELAPAALVARENARLVHRLARVEAHQRALLDGMTDLAWMKDEAGRYIAVNQAFAAFRGRAQEDFAGRTDRDIEPPDAWERLRAQDLQVMETGAPLRDEVQMAGADGRLVWLEKLKTPLRDGDGRIAGTVGTARDVTARKELEALRLRARDETLRDREERYRLLARTIPGAAVFVVDRALRCTLAEGPLLEALGVDAAACVGKAIALGPGDHAVVRELLRRALAGATGEAELAIGGACMTARAAPLRRPDGAIDGALVIAMDVTERRQLEERLRHAQKMEAVGRLAGGVAHDFNNILTVILGSAGELGEVVGGEARALVDEVVEAGHRAAALTRQLLAFSRQQALRPRELDVNEVVRGVERMLRRLIGEDVHVETALGEALGSVRADPGQLEQVLMNLVVNARDAMPEGGRLALATRNVDGVPPDAIGRSASGGPHVLLSVTDSGCGMAPAVRDHLFEPFFTTKERGKGTGLGLATVFGIVRQSGGAIAVDTAPGRGTTFRVYLPCSGAPAAAHRAGGDEAGAAGGTETLLLVEDDAAVRAFMRRALEGLGYRVLAATGAEEARALAGGASAIDLLVSDVVMPDTGGPELAGELRLVRPGLRVLFVSGYTDDARLRSGALEAWQGFLQKPFTERGLARAVRGMLDAA